MNVSLTAELEKLVQEKVQSGFYLSASEVVREGLRLLQERDGLRQLRLEELRKQLAKGLDQLDGGDYTDYNDATLKTRLEAIKRKGNKRPRHQRKKAR